MPGQPPPRPTRSRTRSFENADFSSNSHMSDEAGPASSHMPDNQYRQPAPGRNVQRQVSDPERKGHSPPYGQQVPHPKMQAQYPPSSSPSSGEDISPARSPPRSPSSHLFVPPRFGPPHGKPGTPPNLQNLRFVSQNNVMSPAHVQKHPSEESRALQWGTPSTNSTGSKRGSMILYKLATDDVGMLTKPPTLNPDRNSTASSGDRDSVISVSSDSKYPIANILNKDRGFIPYAYDPLMDFDNDPVVDALHDPKVKSRGSALSWRGIVNIAGLVALLLAILCLFIGYPIVLFSHDKGRAERIANNPRINSTGQAIDEDVPVGRRSVTRWMIPQIRAAEPQSLPDVLAQIIPA